MTMISAKGISKSFGTKRVLHHLNLSVEKEETLVILGRSGIGKSVLLRLLIGLDQPDEGTIAINGAFISSLKGAALFKTIRKMGMLFQGGALFDSLTVEENVSFYLNQNGDPDTGEELPLAEINQRALQALEMVGLAEVADFMPSSLSGGMRKRAALARLIAYRPTILLCDEPTTGLDPITAMQINRSILAIHQELKTTNVVVTHDLVSALEIGDRLALLHDGQIELIVNKADFLQNDHPLIQSFLENAGLKRRSFL